MQGLGVDSHVHGFEGLLLEGFGVEMAKIQGWEILLILGFRLDDVHGVAERHHWELVFRDDIVLIGLSSWNQDLIGRNIKARYTGCAILIPDEGLL